MEFILLQIFIMFSIVVTVALLLQIVIVVGVAKSNVIATTVMTGLSTLFLDRGGAQLGLQNGTGIRIAGVQLTETGRNHFIGVC